MSKNSKLLDRFHGVLVDEIRRVAPEYLHSSFSVAEIYQSLIPYRTHRDRLGIEINGDYEDVILRLLAGEGDFLVLESEPARNRIRKELQHSNPNTGIYREFAAVSVRLSPDRIPDVESVAGGPTPVYDDGEAADRTSLEVPRREAEEVRSIEFADESSLPEGVRAQLDHLSASSHRSVSTDRGGPRTPHEGPGPLMECPDCHEALPVRDSLRFCPHCGGNVLEVPCGACGEVLLRSWNYCVACGHSTAS